MNHSLARRRARRRRSSTARRSSTRRSASCSPSAPGVLNLGVEGMMLVGAVIGLLGRAADAAGRAVVACRSPSSSRRSPAALMSLIHAFLVITLRANQIVSGLALTIFAGAAGLSSYLGNDLNLADAPARHSFEPRRRVRARATCRSSGRSSSTRTRSSTCPGSASLAVGVYLSRTRPGLNVRAVGESPAAADAMGINVTRYRYAHTLAGGALRGSRRRLLQPRDHAAVGRRAHGGGRLDRDRARHLRVLARRALPRRRLRLRRVLGAARSRCRRAASRSRRELFQALPYVMTIVVLVLVSSALGAARRLGAPAGARRAVRARGAVAVAWTS